MSEKKNAVSSTAFVFTDEVVEKALPFQPRKEFNNLCTGVIKSVEIVEDENPKIKEDGTASNYEYAGITTPRIVIEFEQTPTKEDANIRKHFYQGKVIVSKDSNGEAISMKTLSSLYKGLYDSLRHICNAFKGLPTYNTALGSAPALDPMAAPSVRAQQFREFFEYFKALLQGTDEVPVYNNIPLWIKVVADYSKGTFYTFPNFVDTGFVERIVSGKNPGIYIRPNETVELKKKEKASSAEATIAGGGTINATQADTMISPDVKDIIAQYQ